MGEHKHDYIEMVLCSHCENESIDTAVATIARLQEERDATTKLLDMREQHLDRAWAERDEARSHLATMKLPTPATGESAIEFAQRVLREHAEMRGKDWDKLDDELCVACMWSQLILAAGDSARLVLHKAQITEAVKPYRDFVRAWLDGHGISVTQALNLLKESTNE